MPLTTSENGAAVFLVQDSDDWKHHVAKHGPMLAHSTVSGLKGRWVRTSEFEPPPPSEKYAPKPNSALPTPPVDAVARARIDAALALFKTALANKNLDAFERPKPVDPDLVVGATDAETERLTAEAKLKRWETQPKPAIKLGRYS